MSVGVRFHVAKAPRRDSKYWTNETVDWDEFLEWVKHPADRKESGNYILGELDGEIRSKRTIVSRDAITLDADDTALADLPALIEMAFPYAAIVHTTYSSTPDQPRYRVIVPTDRALAPDEYTHAAGALAEMLGGLEHFDRSSLEPERFMFRPATANPDSYSYTVVEGPQIPAEELLAGFEPDLWGRKPARTQKRNPLEIEGPVGAFNRVYGFQEVIDAFDLPYEAAGDGPWSLKGTRAVAGLNDIGSGFVFSHHITDPAYGKTCSAFDLVRIHLFGDEDENVTASTPVHNRPSHKSMCDFVIKDPKVASELAQDFDKWEDDDSSTQGDWVLQFRKNQAGKPTTAIQNWELIAENDPVALGLRYNEDTFSMETQKDFPWRPIKDGGPELERFDTDMFSDHIEKSYGVRPPERRAERIALRAARQRWYSPVRDYLKSLVWDGTPRLEECLPGVRPTPYTRIVARKALAAAVARVFEPGIKWDHVLVLYGRENIGKSHWIETMSRGHTAPLGRLEQKDTLISIHRSWIVVADESFALRKADSELMKAFLTRKADVFRTPYDTNASERRRRFVIWATTNDEYFLRPQEGNRRFLIVHCENQSNFAQLADDDYVDQVWAEAVQVYRSGEKLWLESSESKLAKQEREQYTEEEQYRGVIGAFLADKDSTSVVQLWVEAIGGDLAHKDARTMKTLLQILKSMPDWVESGYQPTTSYGHQTVFVRQGPSAEWPEETSGEELL